jgi:hypothetical protein
MNWFDKNPYGPNPSMMQEERFAAHIWGRQNFASNFAQGGMASTLFAPTAGEAFLNPWRRQHKFGSDQHIRNLESMLARDPNNVKISKAIDKAKLGAGKARGMLGRLAGAGGLALGAGFIALPAFITPGGPAERARAVAGGIAGYAGWSVGAKLGLGIGTAIAGPIGGVIGGIVGAFGGSMLADDATQSILRIPDRLVDRERSRRRLDWVGDKSAFQTERASTMRARSMEMMNRGMMTSRSLLGREAVMLHQ